MKITAVEPFHISVPYDFSNSAQNAAAVQWPKMETLFVKVTTDEGVVGWGVPRAPPRLLQRRSHEA